MSQKEELLLKRLHNDFEKMGPASVKVLQQLVTDYEQKLQHANVANSPYKTHEQKLQHGNAAPQHTNQEQTSTNNSTSLRGIERFFLRMAMMDDEVAFFRVTKVAEPNPTQVTDSAYNPNYVVEPIHVFAAFKRMTTMYVL
jgi:hypothetical protein